MLCDAGAPPKKLADAEGIDVDRDGIMPSRVCQCEGANRR
jgi:hypothetical protein